MRAMSNILPAMVALLLAMVAINSTDVIHKWWEKRGPAIVWYGVSISPETVRPGDVMQITYTANVNRQCPADIRGFIFAPDGSVPVRFPVAAGGYTRPTDGPDEITVDLVMPLKSDPGRSPLRSGRHVYRNLITRYCPSGVEIDANVPDVPFYLEVP